MKIGLLFCFLIFLIFLLFTVYIMLSKRAVGFWTCTKIIEVDNVKVYNAKMAALTLAFSIGFILSCIPVLFVKQGLTEIFIAVCGISFDFVLTVALYTLFIEKKHRIRDKD